MKTDGKEVRAKSKENIQQFLRQVNSFFNIKVGSPRIKLFLRCDLSTNESYFAMETKTMSPFINCL